MRSHLVGFTTRGDGVWSEFINFLLSSNTVHVPEIGQKPLFGPFLKATLSYTQVVKELVLFIFFKLLNFIIHNSLDVY